MEENRIEELKKSLENLKTDKTSQPESGKSLGKNILLLAILVAIVGIWLPFLSIAVGWKVLLTIGVIAGGGALLPNEDVNSGSSEKNERKTLVATLVFVYKSTFYEPVHGSPSAELKSYWINRLGEEATMDDLRRFGADPNTMREFLERPKGSISFRCQSCKELTVVPQRDFGLLTQCICCKAKFTAPDPRLEASKDVHQNVVVAEQPGKVIALFNAAKQLFSDGNLDEAHAKFTELRELAPQLPGPNYFLACIADSRKCYDEALESINRELEIRGPWLSSHVVRASIHINMGNTELAQSDISAAEGLVETTNEARDAIRGVRQRLEQAKRRTEPADIDALEKTADQFRKRYENGKFDEVIAELTPVLPALDKDSKLRKILSSTCSDRGGAMCKRGNLKQALADFEMAVRANPENWRALVNLSTLYVQGKRLDEAQDALEKALEINSSLSSNSQITAQLDRLRARRLP